MQQAIDYEVQWQIATIEDGGRIQQATVLFDPASGETRAMRTKEDAHDYRYFPDPDLLPLVIDRDWIERARAAMPELPAAKRERFMRRFGLVGLRRRAAHRLVRSRRLFEATLSQRCRRTTSAAQALRQLGDRSILPRG